MSPIEMPLLSEIYLELGQVVQFQEENAQLRSALAELLPKHIIDCAVIDESGNFIPDGDGAPMLSCRCPENIQRIRALIEN